MLGKGSIPWELSWYLGTVVLFFLTLTSALQSPICNGPTVLKIISRQQAEELTGDATLFEYLSSNAITTEGILSDGSGDLLRDCSVGNGPLAFHPGTVW